MNQSDKKWILFVIIISIVSYIPIIWYANQYADAKKEVVVQYKNDEILRKNLEEDNIYNVKGTLGDVQIEVKDNSVRVEKENSPYHLCSIQGWVKSVNQPIICLPNEVIVTIEAKEESSVDVVIQ